MRSDEAPMHQLSSITEHPALREALRTTFGGADIEALEPIRGGLSGAFIAKLRIQGRSYVMRSTGPSQGTERELACLRIAAERGLAPKLLYASAEHGVSISAFVEAPTLSDVLRAGGDYAAQVGLLLRRLHDGPAFPGHNSAAAACKMFAAGLAAAGVAIAPEVLSRVDAIDAVLARHRTVSPCHHDVNPGNILVDGERLYLIDWQAASQGDPFHDLVSPGLFSPRLHAQQPLLVQVYLGREPNEQEQARLLLARTIALTLAGLAISAAALHMPPRAPGAEAEPVTPLGDPARYAQALEKQARDAFESEAFARAVAVLS